MKIEEEDKAAENISFLPMPRGGCWLAEYLRYLTSDIDYFLAHRIWASFWANNDIWVRRYQLVLDTQLQAEFEGKRTSLQKTTTLLNKLLKYFPWFRLNTP